MNWFTALICLAPVVVAAIDPSWASTQVGYSVITRQPIIQRLSEVIVSNGDAFIAQNLERQDVMEPR